MSGNKLSCDFHMISSGSSVMQGLINCLTKCNINIEEFLISSITEGIACCTYNKEINTFLITDFGHLSTSFAIFIDETPVFSGFIPMGGFNMTNDLAQVLNIKYDLAEKVKVLFC